MFGPAIVLSVSSWEGQALRGASRRTSTDVALYLTLHSVMDGNWLWMGCLEPADFCGVGFKSLHSWTVLTRGRFRFFWGHQWWTLCAGSSSSKVASVPCRWKEKVQHTPPPTKSVSGISNCVGSCIFFRSFSLRFVCDCVTGKMTQEHRYRR